MANEQNQNARAGYQLDNSKCANGGGTLNAHLYRQGGGVGRITKLVIRSAST